jgi:hypothetical protein
MILIYNEEYWYNIKGNKQIRWETCYSKAQRKETQPNNISDGLSKTLT